MKTTGMLGDENHLRSELSEEVQTLHTVSHQQTFVHLTPDDVGLNYFKGETVATSFNDASYFIFAQINRWLHS